MRALSRHNGCIGSRSTRSLDSALGGATGRESLQCYVSDVHIGLFTSKSAADVTLAAGEADGAREDFGTLRHFVLLSPTSDLPSGSIRICLSLRHFLLCAHALS